jgi:hypothetical protein
MISTPTKQRIRKLYDRGFTAREIKQQLGIDAFTYRNAVKAYWNTKNRRYLYGKRSKARSARKWQTNTRIA